MGLAKRVTLSEVKAADERHESARAALLSDDWTDDARHDALTDAYRKAARSLASIRTARREWVRQSFPNQDRAA